MKSRAGKLFFGVIWLLVLGNMVSLDWEQFAANHSGASIWDYLRDALPLLGQLAAFVVGIFVLGALASVVAPRLATLCAPPRNPAPPADAGPLYAMRTFPIHVGICVGLTAGVALTLLSWSVVAMILIVPAIGAWVLLARRMGFEPSNDPAASHSSQGN
ncbi:hypothetical protein [Brevundimonas sp.]|uniref:hypothetical protein n=1 Tax=Brevundimonas sp. TaxID=1871086 RepID=UPI003D0F68D0